MTTPEPSAAELCSFLSALGASLPEKAESLDQLEGVLTLLDAADVPCDPEEPSPKWLGPVRIGLRSLVQGRQTTPERRRTALRLAAGLLGRFGWSFVAADPESLALMAQLAAVELRILLSGDMQKDTADVVWIAATLETATLLGNDDAVPMDDKVAMAILKAVSESAGLVLEFLGASAKAKLRLHPDVEFPLLRAVAAFLAKGGAACIEDRHLLKSGAEQLVLSGLRAQASEAEFPAASLLLPALSQLPPAILRPLSPNTARLLLHHFKASFADLRRASASGDPESVSGAASSLSGEAEGALGLLFTPLPASLAADWDAFLSDAGERDVVLQSPVLRLSLCALRSALSETGGAGVSASAVGTLCSFSGASWATLLDESRETGLHLANSAAALMAGLEGDRKAAFAAQIDTALGELAATASGLEPTAQLLHALSALRAACAND